MIQTNIAWADKNALNAKMPIYALTIGSLATYTTHDLARAGVTGTLPEYSAWLKTPSGTDQTINVQQGSSSIGELQCEVVDKGGAVRALAGANTLEGQAATLRVGYPGIAWNEFLTVASMVVSKAIPCAGYGAWRITARDRQVWEKRTVYNNPENGERLSEENPWVVTGTPAEIFQAVLLWGLSLPSTAIDLAGLAALDDPAEGLYCATRPFLFSLAESFEAKQWLENEVLKPAGLYPVVLESGQLSLRGPRQPANGPAVAWQFTQDNVAVLPEIDRMPIVNEAVWKFDQDAEGTFRTELTRLEGESITTFGRAGQFSVDSAGLRSELGAWQFTRWVSNRLFSRFAGTPAGLKGGAPVITVQSFYAALPVWAGDFVTLAHDKMPNVLTGAVGGARIYEVIGRQPDYTGGRMRWKLLDTGVTGTGAACRFGSEVNPVVVGTSEVF